jgi:hypothetical protein
MAESAPAPAVVSSAPPPAAPAREPGVGRLNTDGSSLKAPKDTPVADASAIHVDAPTTVNTEAKPEAKAEPKKDDEKAKVERRAERFARLAREEAAIRGERDRIKARESELGTKEQAMAERLKLADRFEYFDNLMKLGKQATPEGRAARQKYLAETGLDFSALAKDVVEGDKVDARAVVQAELEKYKAESETAAAKRETKAAEDRAQQATAQQIAQTKAQLKRLVTDSGEKFELTRENDASDAAFDLMVKQYLLDKTVIPLEAALEKIEQDLERQEKAKYERSTKLRTLVTPAATTKASSKQKDAPGESLKASREPPATRPVGKPAASEPSARRDVEPFNPKRHVNELLARHKARLNT